MTIALDVVAFDRRFESGESRRTLRPTVSLGLADLRLFPGGGATEAAPPLSKLRREALAEAVDPETASSARLLLQPRREGSASFPQNRR